MRADNNYYLSVDRNVFFNFIIGMLPVPPSRFRCAHPSRPSAFTLIELLVVIAIMGILIALTTGALRGAKLTAQQAECTSNLRQIGASLMMFAAENNGMLPRATIKKDETGLTADLMWSKQLGPYLPQRTSSITAPVNIIFNCPAANYPGYPKTDDLSGTYHCSSALYAMESFSSPASNGAASGPPGVSRRLSVLEYPTKTILVGEGKSNAGTNACQSNVNWGQCAADLAASAPTGTTYLDFRHQDKMNVAYADGHIAPIKFSDRATISKPVWEGRNYP
jgi:prepilin-type N-terminal cleavage/methylation domain-containing protein/prepilin-type processing-associated H-X9-DG protein